MFLPVLLKHNKSQIWEIHIQTPHTCDLFYLHRKWNTFPWQLPELLMPGCHLKQYRSSQQFVLISHTSKLPEIAFALTHYSIHHSVPFLIAVIKDLKRAHIKFLLLILIALFSLRIHFQKTGVHLSRAEFFTLSIGIIKPILHLLVISIWKQNS